MVLGSSILIGSTLLAGCGLSGNVTATPTGNGHYNISGTVHSSGTLNSTSSQSSSSPSHASNPSNASVSASSPTSPTENTLEYTTQQKTFILQAAQAIGLPSATIPTHGFGSQYQNTQRLLASGGGSMLVINYSNFDIQEFTRPMLTGRAVLRTVPLTVLGSSVTGTWNQPPSGSGASPLLTFHTNGMYYLIGGSRALSRTPIDAIAESLTKL